MKKNQPNKDFGHLRIVVGTRPLRVALFTTQRTKVDRVTFHALTPDPFHFWSSSGSLDQRRKKSHRRNRFDVDRNDANSVHCLESADSSLVDAKCPRVDVCFESCRTGMGARVAEVLEERTGAGPLSKLHYPGCMGSCSRVDVKVTFRDSSCFELPSVLCVSYKGSEDVVDEVFWILVGILLPLLVEICVDLPDHMDEQLRWRVLSDLEKRRVCRLRDVRSDMSVPRQGEEGTNPLFFGDLVEVRMRFRRDGSES